MLSRRPAAPAPIAFVLMLTASAAPSGCASRVIACYSFEFAGTVTAPDGKPLPGVLVTLEVATSLYSGVTSSRRALATTQQDGSFTFGPFLSHDLAGTYTVLLEKQGFKPLVVGSDEISDAPPVFVLRPLG